MWQWRGWGLGLKKKAASIAMAILVVTSIFALTAQLQPVDAPHLFPYSGPVPVVIGLISAGLNRDVAMNTVTDKIYTAGESNVVRVIDGSSHALEATVTVGAVNSQMGSIAVNPNTNLVYVADIVTDSVIVIDGSSNTILTTISGFSFPSIFTFPFSITVNPTTNLIYVANMGEGFSVPSTISVIDGTPTSSTFNTVIATISGFTSPSGIGVNPTNNKIYVAHQAAFGTVSVIDGTPTSSTFNTVIATIGSLAGACCPSLGGVAVNPGTNRIYVGGPNTGVKVINGNTNTVVATIIGPFPNDIAVNTIKNRIYAVNQFGGAQGLGTVSIIDGATNSVVATLGTFAQPPGFPFPVQVFAIPLGIAINPATNLGYVINAGGVGVTMIFDPSFDFSVAASPTSQPVAPGQSVIYTVTVSGTGVLPTLSLSVTNCPGIFFATCTFGQTSGTPPFTTTLTIATTSAFPQGTFPLTISATGEGLLRSTNVQLIVDATAPAGSVVINGGAPFTNSATVTITLSCSDGTGSGCSQMRIAADGVLDMETFEAFSTTKTVTLPAGDGTKTVAVEFKDAAGNVSTPATDTIILDTTMPAAPTLLSPANSAATGDTTPTFDWTDVADTSTPVTYDLLVDNNADFSSPEISQTALATSTFTPTTALADDTYSWKARARDAAGNIGSFSSVFSVTVFLDSNADGIADSIQTGANSFSDTTTSPPTTGQISGGSGSFQIFNEPSPSGVRIIVSGGNVVIKLCGQNSNTVFTPGSYIMTCTSSKIQVISGQGQYLVGGTSVIIDPGETATISETLTAGQLTSFTVMSNAGTIDVHAGIMVSIQQGGSVTFALTDTSVTVSSTTGNVNVGAGTVVSDAAAQAIVHGATFNRDTILTFKKDNVEVKAHDGNDPCVVNALNTLLRSQQAQFIHDNCISVGGSPQLTGADGRALVRLQGGSSYMLTGHDSDDLAIFYKSRIIPVASGEVQNFGFNKFVISGSYYAYAMGETAVVSSASTLNLQYPDYVDWIYSPYGIYMYYPFLLKSDGSWTIEVCTSVPTGYQIVGSNCQTISLTAGEIKAVLFQVQKLGSPDPDMKVKIKATHKGKSHTLDLDVPGKKKDKEKEHGGSQSSVGDLQLAGIILPLTVAAGSLGFMKLRGLPMKPRGRLSRLSGKGMT